MTCSFLKGLLAEFPYEPLGIYNTGVSALQGLNGGKMHILGRNDILFVLQSPGSAGIRNKQAGKAKVMRSPDGSLDTHVGLHATDHQLLDGI